MKYNITSGSYNTRCAKGSRMRVTYNKKQTKISRNPYKYEGSTTTDENYNKEKKKQHEEN